MLALVPPADPKREAAHEVKMLSVLLTLLSAPQSFPPAPPESVGISAAALGELAEAVQGYLDDDLIVGAELLVIKQRRTVLHEVYGWRDREDGIAMERETVFNVRSMTKPFVGAAIQMLIDEGALALDDKAAQYLPGFRNEKSKEITIGQLLAHRSGLPLTIFKNRIDAYADLEAQVDAIGAAGPQFTPGSKFWYSDAGTDALAAIVQIVGGENLETFVAERLLEPLGMGDSFYLSTTTPHAQDRVASMYMGAAGSWSRIWRGRDPPFYPYPWGSQTLFSTPRDYAHFLALWMDGGRAGDTPLLSEEAIARILTPTSRMSMLGSDLPFITCFHELEAHYGQMSVLYVPTRKPAAGPILYGHSGSDGTLALAVPALDLMILYFTQSRGGLTVVSLEREIDRLFLRPLVAQYAAPVPEALAPCVGPYHLGWRQFDVFAQEGGLAIDVPDSIVFKLQPPKSGADRWALTGAEMLLGVPSSLRFVKDEGGAVQGIKFFQGAHASDLQRGPAPAEPKLDPAELPKYAGRYREEGAGDHEILVKDGRLALRLADAVHPLLLFAPDEEGWRVVRARPACAVRFHVADDGRIDSCGARIDGRESTWKRVEDRR